MKTLVLDDKKKLELAHLQNDFREKSKIARLAKERLENFIKDNTIDELNDGLGKIIERDLSLVVDLLKKNKTATSKEICDFLNEKLKNVHVRWSDQAKYYGGELTTAIFHSYIGHHMINDYDKRFTYDKGKNNRYIWSLC